MEASNAGGLGNLSFATNISLYFGNDKRVWYLWYMYMYTYVYINFFVTFCTF